jgi:hypothetical protein
MPPHFHIEGRGFRAIVEIETMLVLAGGCGQFMMLRKHWNAVLVDLLPKLVPPAVGEDERSQA